ncbi:hypothetical protein PROFUN_04319 [Planoprotostelium fungivorum]|uniref:Uncharacterized protein n=1 Tax=Planoprotostelium fungivorum TaxID=1890364 RepID=A0A2P6NV59_9EUKA|nr:hypothetical protein PROFUN_04319 [Planoprotostelium fungivorum]
MSRKTADVEILEGLRGGSDRTGEESAEDEPSEEEDALWKIPKDDCNHQSKVDFELALIHRDVRKGIIRVTNCSNSVLLPGKIDRVWKITVAARLVLATSTTVFPSAIRYTRIHLSLILDQLNDQFLRTPWDSFLTNPGKHKEEGESFFYPRETEQMSIPWSRVSPPEEREGETGRHRERSLESPIYATLRSIIHHPEGPFLAGYTAKHFSPFGHCPSIEHKS